MTINFLSRYAMHKLCLNKHYLTYFSSSFAKTQVNIIITFRCTLVINDSLNLANIFILICSEYIFSHLSHTRLAVLSFLNSLFALLTLLSAERRAQQHTQLHKLKQM